MGAGIMCLSAGREGLWRWLATAWLRRLMKASFSLLVDRAHIIHHQKPISERQWEKCGASGTPSIPISENEKTNNRTWLGIIAEGIIVFTDSLLLEEDRVCLRDQIWFNEVGQRSGSKHHTVTTATSAHSYILLLFLCVYRGHFCLRVR